VTDEPLDQDATAASAEPREAGADPLQPWSDRAEQPTWTPIEPEGGQSEAANGADNRVRRPSSLLGDSPIPPRASALRHSLGEKISAVTHHGGAPTEGGAGATTPARGGGAVSVAELTERVRTLAADRPEVVVGAAFAGGLVLAAILKRLAR
jgi:hypothetical protein